MELQVKRENPLLEEMAGMWYDNTYVIIEKG